MNNGVTICVNANTMRINISFPKKSSNFDGVYNVFQLNKTLLVVVSVFPSTPESVTNFWLFACHEDISLSTYKMKAREVHGLNREKC